MDWTEKPYTRLLIQKQFEFAGLEFNDNTCDEPEWFSKNEWTIEQESSYKEWFIDFLAHNRLARKEIMQIPSLKSKKILEKLWSWWNLAYGLKLK